MPRSPLTQLPHGEIIASHPSHDDAKDTVRHLARQGFDVRVLSIVGSGIHMVESVEGSRSWGAAAWRGAVSGAWLGLVAGLVVAMVGGQEALQTLTFAPIVVVCIGIGMIAALGLKALGRKQGAVVTTPALLATSYEVVCPLTHTAEAKRLLAQPRTQP